MKPNSLLPCHAVYHGLISKWTSSVYTTCMVKFFQCHDCYPSSQLRGLGNTNFAYSLRKT